MAAQPMHSGAVNGGAEHVKRRGRVRAPRGKRAASTQRCTISMPSARRLLDQGEALPIPGDSRDRAIHEHQPEILGLLLAELVVAPEAVFERGEPDRRCAAGASIMLAETAEALIRERDEDVVFRREIEVQRRRAVVDLLRDLPHGHVIVAFLDEQLAGCLEDGAAHRVTVPAVAFPAWHAWKWRLQERRGERCSRSYLPSRLHASTDDSGVWSLRIAPGRVASSHAVR